MILLAAASLALALPGNDCSGAVTICTGEAPGAVALIDQGRVATVVGDAKDDISVQRVIGDLRSDLTKVAGTATAAPRLAVIVGSLGHNAIVDRLVAEKRIDASAIKGQWEAYLQQVVDKPAPGIDRALVIVGSDARGAIYGVYDLSTRMGVSPWSWWADVPIVRRERLSVSAGSRSDRPAVRYRGIFLNDEDPALKGWATATFGGFNEKFYSRVFELILRLKGNLLWPAMWGKAFYDDDANNKPTARRYNVIIGTSHHEPLMRAHVEWERYGKGPWDYSKNAAVLQDFWRTGLARADGSEHLVTVGMRGDGDEPMTQGTAISLLEQIVTDQREIIEQVTGKPATETPQVWALYKEVQDYYDKGMRVPDDVTLLFSDDNWGDIRRLPKPGVERSGGYGVYYHFDYVGGPRNYKWINTNQISRTWEQMKLARAYGADRLWIVNVGDLKPMELPISFFLDLAWNPEAWPVDRMADYHKIWAAQQFGPGYAAQIGDYLDRTTWLLARRKPELLDADTWSLQYFREAEGVIGDYDRLEKEARETASVLPAEARDAYYQLVLHPIEASANLNRLYVTVANNRLHAAQGRNDVNALADEAAALFANDRAIHARYEAAAGGKWVHMMDQTHIGYTIWQQPDADVMPKVERNNPGSAAAMGVAVEGDAKAWVPGQPAPTVTPFERFGHADRRIDVFNRGVKPFALIARSDSPWLVVVDGRGTVETSKTIRLAVDWSRAPPGTSRANVTISGPSGTSLALPVAIVNRNEPTGTGFIEADGYVAIEAEHFAHSNGASGAQWTVIPGLGRTLSATTPMPQSPNSFAPGNGPSLDYDVLLFTTGNVTIDVLASPSLDVAGGRGLRYAIGVDDEAPKIVDLIADNSEKAWNESVIEAARVGRSSHAIGKAGRHRIRLWAVDPGVVVQRLVLATGPLPKTALGPPESQRR